jgi:4-aminobutyrate aminotransferase-like enzyme
MGNVLTLTPPLITTAAQMDEALTTLEEAISDAARSAGLA